MSKQQEWIEWVRKSPGWILGAIGLISAIVTFLISFKDNFHLVAFVTIATGCLALLFLCIYLRFAKTPPLVHGGRGVYRFGKGRRWALVGIVLIPVLSGAVLASDPGRDFVEIAVFGTPIPAATATATLAPTMEPTDTSIATATSTPIPTATATSTPIPTATATSTPIPTATATSTPIPTATATQTPAPSLTPKPEFPIEDFEGYDNDIELANSFEINRNAGNDGRITLVGKPHKAQGLQAMAFEFEIRSSDQNKDYIGFNREIPVQDWSDYSEICFWIGSDGSNRTLILQFGKYETGIHREAFSLSQGAGDYCISLQDKGINLREVGYYGLYIHAPPTGSSIIYVDNIRLK
jgi:hypothetical protein